MNRGVNRWLVRSASVLVETVPVARRSVNGPAKAWPTAAAAVAPAPTGALVSRSGVTPRETLERPTCDESTWRPEASCTRIPKAAGARPPTLAATSCSPSNSRAISIPPYGNARWFTGTTAVL
jgi:hypothetical protein